MDRTPHSAVPVALPFDDEGDAPVPFGLTAAARRALDPDGVPALRVVPDRPEDVAPTPDVEEVAADDLRPAQARALRRSGMPVVTIAAAMDVDPALVATWTADLQPGRGAVRRPQGDRPARSVPRRSRPSIPSSADPTAAAGLAVALARIDVDGAAMTLRGDQPALVATALSALRTATRIRPERVRVAVALGRGHAADHVRAELAQLMGLPVDRVVVGRPRDPATDATLDIRVRVAERRAVQLIDDWAARIAGACEGLRTAT